MGVREIRIEDLPRATRNRVSPIRKTKDWKATIAAIRKNRFQVLEVEFSRETLVIGKVTALRFKLALQSELKTMGRDDLKVMFRGHSQTGARMLYVVRRAGRDDSISVLPGRNDRPNRSRSSAA